ERLPSRRDHHRRSGGAGEAGHVYAGVPKDAGLRDGGVRLRQQPRVHRREGRHAPEGARSLNEAFMKFAAAVTLACAMAVGGLSAQDLGVLAPANLTKPRPKPSIDI